MAAAYRHQLARVHVGERRHGIVATLERLDQGFENRWPICQFLLEIAAGDTVTAQAVAAELDQARSDARTAAESFGFEECGQEGTPIDPGDATTPAPVCA